MHLLFLQKCFREGMIGHPSLYLCRREELVSRVGNAFIRRFVLVFVFFFLLNVDGGAFVCVS